MADPCRTGTKTAARGTRAVRLWVVGDAIVSDEHDVVATFHPQLLPTRRERAEALLMLGAAESEWELRERCYEQQDRIEELEEELKQCRATK